MRSVWCVYTVELLPAVKDNEMLTYATTYVDLDKIVLREVSREQKLKCHMISPSSETATKPNNLSAVPRRHSGRRQPTPESCPVNSCQLKSLNKNYSWK